jgi:hypothetical protein
VRESYPNSGNWSPWSLAFGEDEVKSKEKFRILRLIDLKCDGRGSAGS